MGYVMYSHGAPCIRFPVRDFANDHTPPHVHVFAKVARRRSIWRRMAAPTVTTVNGIRGLTSGAFLIETRERHAVLIEAWWTDAWLTI